YESKRLLDGDVFYRDVFEIITPGSFYLMAAALRLFGIDIGTARMFTALINATIAVLLYLTCRGVGVRRELAVLPALFHLTFFYPANAIASPRWVATLLQAALLCAFVRLPVWSSKLWLALAGALTGALVLVQQHKGVT